MAANYNTHLAVQAPNPTFPPFFFTIDGMKVNPRREPRFTANGIWLPPVERKGSVTEVVSTTDKLYFFNGQTVSQVQATPAQLKLVPYRVSSIYHDNSNAYFWTVPYDATMYAVGPGVAHDPSEADSSATAAYDPPDPTVDDWGFLRFSWQYATNQDCFCASYAMRNGEQSKLFYQRPGQRWAKVLFPTTYHAERDRWTADANHQYGGLIGELSIILGLIAYSVKPDDVQEALVTCLQGNSWRGDYISEGHIGRGWRNQRGVIVRIWTGVTEDCTPEALQALETGDYGKMFY